MDWSEVWWYYWECRLLIHYNITHFSGGFICGCVIWSYHSRPKKTRGTEVIYKTTLWLLWLWYTYLHYYSLSASYSTLVSMRWAIFSVRFRIILSILMIHVLSPCIALLFWWLKCGLSYVTLCVFGLYLIHLVRRYQITL